jgi:hypothetical protein
MLSVFYFDSEDAFYAFLPRRGNTVIWTFRSYVSLLPVFHAASSSVRRNITPVILFSVADISVGLVWLMFIVDIIVYGIVTWYISSIIPGRYGFAQPWYFIFLVSYI